MSRKCEPYPIPEICVYCGAPVIFTSNAQIYGREYGNGRCYKCTECDAYVGVHDGTYIPLGRLADRELRALKKRCHYIFDPVWQGKRLRRDRAYNRLAQLLGIRPEHCHFGWFDKDMLLRCLAIMKNPEWYKGRRTA